VTHDLLPVECASILRTIHRHGGLAAEGILQRRAWPVAIVAQRPPASPMPSGSEARAMQLSRPVHDGLRVEAAGPSHVTAIRRLPARGGADAVSPGGLPAA
jgi:hypothetical protein